MIIQESYRKYTYVHSQIDWNLENALIYLDITEEHFEYGRTLNPEVCI